MEIQKNVFGNDLIFQTDESLFSPKKIDKGTLFMLQTAMETAQIKHDDIVLDLGCGYGVVGISIGKIIGAEQVYMVDNNRKATESAAINAKANELANMHIFCGNGLSAVPDGQFTLILCNPPYHTDFSIAKAFIEQGFYRLKTGGRMLVVIKRLDWYKNKLTTVFGGVKVFENDGYFVLIAEKREGKPVRNDLRTTNKHKKKENRALNTARRRERH